MTPVESINLFACLVSHMVKTADAIAQATGRPQTDDLARAAHNFEAVVLRTAEWASHTTDEEVNPQ